MAGVGAGVGLRVHWTGMMGTGLGGGLSCIWVAGTRVTLGDNAGGVSVGTLGDGAGNYVNCWCWVRPPCTLDWDDGHRFGWGVVVYLGCR